jgi:hypothetical protein
MAIKERGKKRSSYWNRIYAAIAISCCLTVGPVMSALSASVAGTITVASFGTLPDGTVIQEYTLRNYQGMQAKIITYGGILTSLTAPDRHGKYSDVVLGYDNLAGYLKASPYFGALIGRYGTSKCLVLDATCK